MIKNNEQFVIKSVDFSKKAVEDFEEHKNCGNVIVKYNIFKGSIVNVSNILEITEKGEKIN
jgi:hypothetical protein